MTKGISFFEIPAKDFDRAVDYYNEVFDLSIEKNECGEEKMGFFNFDNLGGAISYSKNFNPSSDGVLIHFSVDDLDKVLEKAIAKGSNIIREKTKIDGDHGYFALFLDSEGNRIGIHQ